MTKTKEKLQAINWPHLGMEVFSIVLGVLLALSANQWQQNRQKDNQVQTALVHIRHELARNQQWLENRIAYHQPIIEQMNSLIPQIQPNDRGYDFPEKLPLPEELGMDKGLGTSPGMRNVAWTTTGDIRSEVGYEKLFILAEVYMKIEELEVAEAEAVESFTQFRRSMITGEHKAFAIIELSSSLTDLILREQELAQLIQTSLGELP